MKSASLKSFVNPIYGKRVEDKKYPLPTSNEKSREEIVDFENLILGEVCCESVLEFIKNYFDIFDPKTYIGATTTAFNIGKLDSSKVSSVINLKKINDSRYLNKFFESINSKLPNSGLFFGRVETYPNRRKVILSKYPVIINWFVYFFVYFCLVFF